MEYPQFNEGDKVKTIFGEIRIVSSQNECVVYFTNGQRAHPTKIWKVA